MPLQGPLDAYAKRMKQLDLECLAEIKHWLNKFRFDPIYRGSAKRVPLRQFAALCGVSRQTLYDLVRGERKGIEPGTRDRIKAAIALVNGGLRWKRETVRKAIVERIVHSPAIVEWHPIMPDGRPPPPIPKRHLTEKQLAAHDAARSRPQVRIE